MQIERRRHSRTPVRLLVQHQADVDAPVEIDYATDLSPGGLFLRTRNPPAPSAMFHLQFAPARDARLVEAFCRVARVTGEGVGVEFIQLDGRSAAVLEDVLGVAPVAAMAAVLPSVRPQALA